MDNRYQERREEIEAMFIPSNREPSEPENFLSPSNNFELSVEAYSRGPSTWEYSRGRVRRIADGKETADIKRNIGHFFHSWVQHSNGHEYLICGEDYQGQTVVNLTTGEKHVFFPDVGYGGGGFCWTAAWQSPDSTLLAVEGCYWACPYEVVFFDFAEPDLLPYKELLRVDGLDTCNGWLDENTFRMTLEIHVRKADSRPYNELSDNEQDEMDENDDLGTYVKRESLVTRAQILEEC